MDGEPTSEKFVDPIQAELWALIELDTFPLSENMDIDWPRLDEDVKEWLKKIEPNFYEGARAKQQGLDANGLVNFRARFRSNPGLEFAYEDSPPMLRFRVLFPRGYDFLKSQEKKYYKGALDETQAELHLQLLDLYYHFARQLVITSDPGVMRTEEKGRRVADDRYLQR